MRHVLLDECAHASGIGALFGVGEHGVALAGDDAAARDVAAELRRVEEVDLHEKGREGGVGGWGTGGRMGRKASWRVEEKTSCALASLRFA